MNVKSTILFVGILILSSAPALAADRFVPLFDGKTLNGWSVLPGGTWTVIDGAIVGAQEKTERRHGILLSKKKYGNFIVRLKFKALEGNSGLYFRAEKVDHAAAVKGFQAEIAADGTAIGGLYETLGRAWVVQPKPEDVKTYYNDKDWNEMTVTAVGGDVTVTVNGVKTAQLKNDPGPRDGYLGLQLHGGQKMHVLFKDIEIREITNPAQPIIHEVIHDKSRPLPKIVTPKPIASLSDSRQPPPGAIVLFDGTNIDQWRASTWTVKDGILESTKGKLVSKQGFADCKLHVEWRVVDPQGHGNSGVFLMNQYEVQIFNSYHNRSPIYADGIAAAIYGQYPPSVNACRPPGEWEIFDITFHAPRFDPSGKLTKPATISMLHNGIRVHDKAALTGPTDHQHRPPYKKQEDKMPIRIQDHGNRLQFRNIWVLELKS